MCVYLCLQIFVDIVSHEQMRGKSRNFIFSSTLLKTGTDWIFADIAQQVTMLCNIFFDFFYIKNILYLWVFCMEINQTQTKGYLLDKKVFVKFLCISNSSGLLYIFLEFSGIFGFIYLDIFWIELNQTG